jgi:anti-sigma factor RsiW
MKCDKVYLHICDHLDEDINSSRCRQIKQHLAECPNCSAYLDSLKKTITLYRALPAPPVPVGTHRELFRTISTLTGKAAAPVRRGSRKSKKI